MEVDTLESEQQRLEEELHEHIRNEHYEEAAKTQAQLDTLISKDVISTIHTDLDAALAEERYEDAAQLRDEGLVGLTGWWVARGHDDPTGRIVHISRGYCRYIGRVFTPYEIGYLCGVPDSTGVGTLMHGSDAIGTFALEVYFRRDPKGMLQHQGCVLRQPELVEEEVEDAQTNEERPEINIQTEKNQEEDKVKYTITVIQKDSSQDSSDEEVASILKPMERDGYEYDVLDSAEEFNPLDLQFKLPADLRWWDRNRFVLTVDENVFEEESDEEDRHEAAVQVDKVAEQLPSKSEAPVKGLVDYSILSKMPNPKEGEELPRIEDLFVEERIDLKHLKEMRQQLKNGDPEGVSKFMQWVSQDSDADKLDKLHQWLSDRAEAPMEELLPELEEEMMFSRLPKEEGCTDPFTGVFIGSFGRHGNELLHLSRQIEKSSGKEYVYARKITGDANVPAGEISFRAALGIENRTVPDVRHADELGLRAQYSGKGRIAEPGYKNARWVDGDMLVLDPSSPIAAGAELGLVWNVPNYRRVHILLYRVCLPDVTS